MKEDDLESLVLGHKIRAIRNCKESEQDEEGWDENFTVIELSNGTTLYASRDSEGNGAGAMFGQTPHKKGFAL